MRTKCPRCGSTDVGYSCGLYGYRSPECNNCGRLFEEGHYLDKYLSLAIAVGVVVVMVYNLIFEV